MIEVNEVSKYYGNKKVVDNVSFKVDDQKTLVLLGTSGSGKTTTLKLINRLIDFNSGSIKINGKAIDQISPHILRRNIGYVIQQVGLFPHLNVEQNISITPQLLGWPKNKIKARTSHLLHMLKLDPEEYLNKYPDQLSGGQMQRIGIARALAADPPILLMDEPFGALDPITRIEIRQEFKKLESSIKKTIIIVTHDIDEAVELGDQVCLLNEGSVQQTGKPFELLFKPANAFVRDFFNNNRLNLEFKIVEIQNLWEFIPEAREEPDAPALSYNFSLADAISFMEKNQQTEYFKLVNISSGKSKYCNMAQLITAFYMYKKKNFNGIS